MTRDPLTQSICAFETAAWLGRFAHAVAELGTTLSAAICVSVGACRNPTLTIMAMAVRSTDYLLEQFKKRNL